MDSAGPSPSQPLLPHQRTDSAPLEPDQSSLGRTVSGLSSLRDDEFLSPKSPERPGSVTPSPTTTYSVYRLPRAESDSLQSASLRDRSPRASDSIEELTSPRAVPGPSVPILNHPPEPGSRAESVQDSGFSRRGSIANATAVKEGGTTDSLPDFQRPKTKAVTILAEVLGILAPLGFLAFAIILICIHGSQNVPSTQYLNAIPILATAFPIIFAVFIGRLMTDLVRWKLQKGAQLRLLEQLMGSRTVGGAVLTLFTMPLGWLHVVLLAIWAFSPLGAQSIFRVLEIRHEPMHGSAAITYLDNIHADTAFTNFPFYAHQGRRAELSVPTVIDSMYRAALLSSDTAKASSLDLWGNLKVPMLSFPNDGGGGPSHEWQDVDSSRPVRWSSLAGIPLTGVPVANSTFEVLSSYIELECDATELSDDFSETFLNDTDLRSPPTNVSIANGTWQGFNLINRATNETFEPAMWTLGLDNFVSPLWLEQAKAAAKGGMVDAPSRPSYLENKTDTPANPTRLRLEVARYGSKSDAMGGLLYYRATFRVRQRYVQSRVSCSRSPHHAISSPTPHDCAVIAQRPSPNRHPSADISQLSYPEIFGYISGRLPPATGFTIRSESPDPSIVYLIEPSTQYLLNFSIPMSRQLREQLPAVSKEGMGTRLTQLVNTYLHLGQSFDVAATGTADQGEELFRNSTTAAAVTNLEEVYQVSGAWMTVFIVSSLVFLAGSILSIGLQRATWAPEVLGYASTVIRDSRFVDLDEDDRRLDGMDLTKKFRDARVKFGWTRQLSEDQTRLLGVGWERDVRGIHE